jgi:hypothetical protein
MISEGNAKVDFLGRKLKVGQYVVYFDIWVEGYPNYAKGEFRIGRVQRFTGQGVVVSGNRRHPEKVCIVDQRHAENAYIVNALKS